VLVDSVAAGRATGVVTLESRGARELPGFAEPIEVYGFSPDGG
jgi:hypothetical protein